MRGIEAPALLAAGMWVVVGALLVPADALAVHGIGWTSCLLAFSAVAAQRRSAARRRATEAVVEARVVRPAAVALLLASTCVIGLHAWFVAWDVASRVGS